MQGSHQDSVLDGFQRRGPFVEPTVEFIVTDDCANLLFPRRPAALPPADGLGVLDGLVEGLDITESGTCEDVRVSRSHCALWRSGAGGVPSLTRR